VAHATFVQILNARNQFAVEFGSLFLGQARVPDDVVEKFTAIRVLHDHEELLLCFDDLQRKLTTIFGEFLPRKAG
jgi:hypothetical protein